MDLLTINNTNNQEASSEMAGVKVSSIRSLPIASPSASPSKNKRKSSSLPPETVEFLKAWMMSPEHIAHPYPTEQEKSEIMEATGIELKQLTNWFVNNRKRFWKPRVEARLQVQSQVKVTTMTPSGVTFITPKRAHSPSNSLSSYSCSSVAAVSVSSSVMDQSIIGTADLMTRMTSNLSNMGSPARAVSEHSSLASSDSEELDDFSTSQQTMEEAMTKAEPVSVHILRPVGGGEPTLEDVTILSNIPAERIVRSYDNCILTYKLASSSSSRRKVQSRRDSEIVRVKKQYLKLYVSENRVAPKRSLDGGDEQVQTPRRKYRRASVEVWKEVCLSTGNSYDQVLPSLEEASQLFGFSD